MFKILFYFLNNWMLFKILHYHLHHLHSNPVVLIVLMLLYQDASCIFGYLGLGVWGCGLGIKNNIEKKCS